MSTPPAFLPQLPNIFGAPLRLTEDELEHVRTIMKDPLVQRVITQHLRAEYQRIIDRNPLKLEPEELMRHHAYLAGAYSLARNLVPSISN